MLEKRCLFYVVTSKGTLTCFHTQARNWNLVCTSRYTKAQTGFFLVRRKEERDFEAITSVLPFHVVAELGSDRSYQEDYRFGRGWDVRALVEDSLVDANRAVSLMDA